MHDADSSQPVLHTYTTLSMRLTGSEPHSLMTLHPQLRRRQHYSIVSDSSFDYFKPTGDDFAKELMSEIWHLVADIQWWYWWCIPGVSATVSATALVFGTSLKGSAPGVTDCHISDIKETRPNGSVGNAFCICFGQVTIYLLSPVTIWHEVTPRSAATYDLRCMIVGRKPLLLCANWCILTLPSYKPSA